VREKLERGGRHPGKLELGGPEREHMDTKGGYNHNQLQDKIGQMTRGRLQSAVEGSTDGSSREDSQFPRKKPSSEGTKSVVNKKIKKGVEFYEE